MKRSVKCLWCDSTVIKPNPTFVYIKCWKCRELIDVRKKKGFSSIEQVMQSMQTIAKVGFKISDFKR